MAPFRTLLAGRDLQGAMRAGIPVITTGTAAVRTLVPDSWHLSWRHVPAADGPPPSTRVEPQGLAAALAEALALSPHARGAIGARARPRVLPPAPVARAPRSPRVGRPPRVGWISSWNVRSGIAAYSAFLTAALPLEHVVLAAEGEALAPDASNVLRCWRDRRDPELDRLPPIIRHLGLEVVVIQLNYAFFDLGQLGRLLDRLHEDGVVVVVMLHATREVVENGVIAHSLWQIREPLGRCARLLVHGIEDLARLRSWGLDNVTLFPHGVAVRTPQPPPRRPGPVLATYGFLLPDKGIVETVEALALVREQRPQARLLLVDALHDDPASAATLARVRERIEALGLAGHVELHTEFLPHEDSVALLESADVVLFPYRRSGESASGAVKVGLAAGRPVLCTDLPVFDDVRDAVGLLPGADPDSIANGVLRLLEEPVAMQALVAGARAWAAARDWRVLARRLARLLEALHRERLDTDQGGGGNPGSS